MSDEATQAARIDQPGLVPETVPSLEDFFEEPTGNIAPGWYRARVLEGYATTRGTQFTTGDQPGKEGRRELRFCFGVTVGGSQRNLQKTTFYAPDQFKPENLAHIKDLRQQFGNKTWPGQGQAQNFSIELTKLSQLQKAIGFKLALHPNGGFLTVPYIGKECDVKVGTDKKGYDAITAFAVAGSHSKAAR